MQLPPVARLANAALVRTRIASERARAQRLRVIYPNTEVHRAARLGRGSRVHVAPGGLLSLGPCAVADNVTLQVGPNGRLRLDAAYVGPGSVIVARESIVVGAGAMLAEMCVVRDSDHLRDPGGAISAHRYSSAPVVVGRDAWLASRVIVLKGVSVGAGATVGAGAVVTKSIPPRSLALGVPARVVA